MSCVMSIHTGVAEFLTLSACFVFLRPTRGHWRLHPMVSMWLTQSNFFSMASLQFSKRPTSEVNDELVKQYQACQWLDLWTSTTRQLSCCTGPMHVIRAMPLSGLFASACIMCMCSLDYLTDHRCTPTDNSMCGLHIWSDMNVQPCWRAYSDRVLCWLQTEGAVTLRVLSRPGRITNTGHIFTIVRNVCGEQALTQLGKIQMVSDPESEQTVRAL